MNISKTLLTPAYQSKEVAGSVAQHACSSPEAFAVLFECFVSDEYRLAQRAAYSLSMAARQRPDLMEPYVDKLVAQLSRKDVHEAVIRNSIRILEEVRIPENLHAELINICFDFVQNRRTSIAVKAFSLTVLFNLSRIYPELGNELRVIIEENIDYETPAFQSRGKKILAKLRGPQAGKRP
ncbi:hypothetical protein [Dyadobacter sandarakinus]|uniref:HEAT repeat-containing protein n=1 Tax=Dyadobacter sandarakinus TaxID=2747268 RepID=A0ABX7IC48_9BACT|nr:hypothetical protein [Dyadobacter sandarakinus]QRR03676.1 hypothetical protein HWI92_23545 [Dyadobacter sandarakinus]